MSPRISPERLAWRRTQILEAARGCFARKGFHVTTIDDVAEESGLSVGSIYKYFPGKEDLFRAIASEDFARLDEEILGHSRGVGAPDEVMRAAVARFLDGVMTKGRSWGPILLEFRSVARSRPDLAEPVRRLMERFHRRLVRLIDEGVAGGVFRPGLDARVMAYVIVAALDGFALHVATGEPAASPSELLDTLLGALRAEARAPDSNHGYDDQDVKSVKARAATTRDVAMALGLCPATVQRYAREGRIPFDETPGGHRRYDLAEVREALGLLTPSARISGEDVSQVRERLRWAPAERLAYLVDMLDFEDAAARGRAR